MAKGFSRSLSTYRGRRSRSIEQRDVILIICVGETEKNYFNRFNLTLGKIRVKTIQEARSPLQLVERAIDELNTRKYAQVWTVFDKDDYDDFDDAIALAFRNRVRVAYSNQAFELWFLLHFNRITGPLHRSYYNQRLSKSLGRVYRKADASIFDLLNDKIEVAIENAKWGFEYLEREYKGKPPSLLESSTTVYQLVEELRRWQ